MQKKTVIAGSLIAALLLVGGWFWWQPTHADVAVAVIGSYHRSDSLDPTFFDGFFNDNTAVTPITVPVSSAVVTHHLVAGKYTADFFRSLAPQNPSVVVILGPNHLGVGKNTIITGNEPWKTAYGFLNVDQTITNELAAKQLATIEEDPLGTEHTIGAVVPFIKHTWPNAAIVPIIVKQGTSSSTLSAIATELAKTLPPHSLVIGSIDFSHYLPYFVADFHDQLAENILATGETADLNKAEVNSQETLYFLSEYNRVRGTQTFHEFAHTNSAIILGKPDLAETTSHFLGFYTAGQPAPTGTFTMQFFGDIMLDRQVVPAMGTKGLDYLFANIRGGENRFFTGTDLLMANFEGAFAPKRVPTSKTIAFRFDPALAPQLKKYNIDAVTLANNHSADMGWPNVTFTKTTLDKAGIAHCGQQYDEGPQFNLTLGQANGLPEPVAFVCFEWVTMQPDKTKLLAALDAAKKVSQYVIVQVHGGTEYRTTSTIAQQNLYHWLIDNGATAIIGNHPHVVEEMEVYKGKPIFYALGNFIFDQYFSKETQEGLSAGLVFNNGAVTQVNLFPFYSVKSQVALMTSTRRAAFLANFAKESTLGGKQIIDGVLNLQ